MISNKKKTFTSIFRKIATDENSKLCIHQVHKTIKNLETIFDLFIVDFRLRGTHFTQTATLSSIGQ